MLIQYVRGRKGGLVGCVVAVPTPDMTVRLGWSKCMVKPSSKSNLSADVFSKKVALDKAVGRAISNQEGMTIQQALLETKPVPTSIKPAIRKMAHRARSYFKQCSFT
jgi:hypothetical protein